MTKLIPILSGRCLVVELPEGAHSPVVDDYLLGFNLPAPKWAGDWSDDSYDTIKLPPGNWRIIGVLSEVREEQIVDIIDSVSVTCTDGTEYGGWRNYVCRDDFDKTILLNTALESLESSILAEGYYLDENPIAVPDFSGGNIRFSETVEYAKAQSRVLDRSRCLLLGREI